VQPASKKKLLLKNPLGYCRGSKCMGQGTVENNLRLERVLECPMKMLVIRMTEIKRQLANQDLPEKRPVQCLRKRVQQLKKRKQSRFLDF